MPFPALKVPKLIYSTSSKYNNQIEVFQIGDHRQLSVNSTVQSISWETPSAKTRVWGRLAELVKDKRPKAKNILMFGLGGGTIAHLLNQYLPEMQLTAVEIDQVMIDVAQKYFELDSIKNLTVIVADALRVCAEPESYNLLKDTFDVVIVDIYCGDKYPDLGKSGTFFSRLRWFVKTGGMVVFNRIYFGDHQFLVDEFIELVENTFSNVSTSTVPACMWPTQH